MSQYDDKVERQRLLLEDEEWANDINSIHIHSLKNIWYKILVGRKTQLEINVIERFKE